MNNFCRDVYHCRNKLKIMREEVHSFVDMFAVLLESEEKVKTVNTIVTSLFKHRASNIVTSPFLNTE